MSATDARGFPRADALSAEIPAGRPTYADPPVPATAGWLDAGLTTNNSLARFDVGLDVHGVLRWFDGC